MLCLQARYLAKYAETLSPTTYVSAAATEPTTRAKGQTKPKVKHVSKRQQIINVAEQERKKKLAAKYVVQWVQVSQQRVTVGWQVRSMYLHMKAS